ncbi:hypothetical protein IKQ19_13395, partial [Candidatus Saccharibacteria bacterium]|nr:hypothetical protein [Candidatus Saccharibacteria bacterium]
MIDNLIWNFPKSGHSTLTSSDNNNIDTFADDRIGNLVREILQNSLDAHSDDQPVRVEFKSFKTKTSDFPGLDTFKSYLEEWKASQTDVEDDDKDLLFVDRALKELAKDEMIWLRVSDFNTTGLWGASSKSNKTPYFSFVHGSGKNAKQSRDSGGSKGVGKNALFANSNLQTIFVSTLTKNKERTFTGVGFLVSSNETDIEKDWTQGVCFCVENNEFIERNRPLNAIVNLDPSFDREKEGIGTDVYIPSFMLEEGWIKEVTGQVIYSFLPALLNNKLIVSVVDGLTELGIDVKTDLDSSTISSLINQSSIYKNKNQQSSCMNIYNALTSTNRKEYVDKSKPGFKMSMYLFEDEFNGDNKLYIYRCPTRMFIKYEPISAFVKCSGVLFVEGEELTQRLRSIEDATHSKWSKSKAIKTKYKKEQIEEALGAVTNFIERTANNFGNNGESNESDFDYMVQNDWCSAEDDHEISKENNKDIGLPVPKAFFSIRNDPSKHSRKKPLKRKSNKITDDESEVTGLIEIEG